jgi:enoyl-CoA hydratase
MNFDNVLVEKDGAVAVVTLNRPQALNALSYALVKDLSLALQQLDQDSDIRVIIVTGGEKVFAAGADIKEMAERGPFDERIQERLAYRDEINRISKPLIAAVSGFALGGGCELAMSCDIVVASETARFGQPEVNLGVMPGAGGTQRLPRAVGKAKAMDLCLTARMMDAQEAERAGLVSRIVPTDKVMEEALAVAEKIASYSLPVVMMLKESINRAYESTLAEGILFERRLFHSQFALADQKEGMAAFLEKRKPTFKHR